MEGIRTLFITLCLTVLAAAQGFPVVRSFSAPSGPTPVLTSMADVDGDGIPDIAIKSAPLGLPIRIDLISGATGQMIRPVMIPVDASFRFGEALLAVGDRDGDGVEDLLVGDPLFNLESGAVFLFSGATGGEIARIVGSSTRARFGTDLDLIEDMDGDQMGEIVVGSPLFANVGRVDILGSASGTSLRTWIGNVADDGFGTGVSVVDDMDLDGMEDVAIRTSPALSQASGRVLIHSTSSGLVVLDFSRGPSTFITNVSRLSVADATTGGNFLVSYFETSPLLAVVSVVDRFGSEVRRLTSLQSSLLGLPVGDVNNDGLVDFGVSNSLGVFPGGDQLVIYSGADFCPLLRLQDHVALSLVTFAPIGDTNGDGFDEVLVGQGGGTLDSLIVTTAGDGLYGPDTALDLEWLGAGGSPFAGSVEIRGGTPNGEATLLAATSGIDLDVGPFRLLVNPNPNQSISAVIPLDASGEASLPAPLGVPAELSIPVFLQAFDFSGPGFEASNGLEVMLTRTTPVPLVDSVSPSWVAPGQPFPSTTLVRGRCFAPNMQATLNGMPLTVIVSPGGQEATLAMVSLVLPPALDSVLELVNPGGTSTIIPYNPSPRITNVVGAVVSTTGGDSVTLGGENFFPGTSVTIGGVGVPLLTAETDVLSFHSPALPAGSASIVVTSPNGGTVSTGVIVTPSTLSITSVSPLAAVAGEIIRVDALGIDVSASVTVGGQVVTPILIDPVADRLFYAQPAGLGCDEDLVIANPDGQSVTRVVNPSPVSTSHTMSGPSTGGNIVTIEGPADGLGASTITIGGIAVVSSPSPIGVQFFAPAHPPGMVDIIVDNGVGCSLTLPYTYQ